MIKVSPAAERGKTQTSWLESNHTFSFNVQPAYAQGMYAKLEAQKSRYELEYELTQSETRVVVSIVALYKAVGGGWCRSDWPSEQSSLDLTHELRVSFCL